jgi:hypothetical protein
MLVCAPRWRMTAAETPPYPPQGCVFCDIETRLKRRADNPRRVSDPGGIRRNQSAAAASIAAGSPLASSAQCVQVKLCDMAKTISKASAKKLMLTTERI